MLSDKAHKYQPTQQTPSQSKSESSLARTPSRSPLLSASASTATMDNNQGSRQGDKETADEVIPSTAGSPPSAELPAQPSVFESVSSRAIRIRREEQEKEARLRAATIRRGPTDDVEVEAETLAPREGRRGAAGGPVTRIEKLTKDEGVAAVEKTLHAMNKGEESAYTLIPVYEWQAKTSGGQRADSATRKLDGFHILCPQNTLKDVGIRVCSSYITGVCPLKRAVFLFSSTVGGTSMFEKHTKTHGPTASASVAVMTLPRAQKAVLADAAAKACVMSQYPFSFTESPGLIHFSNVLFKLGQQCAPAETYDMALSLPKSTCVTTALAKLADVARRQFVKDEYPSLKESFGASCTTDGLKCKYTGRKFYDLCMIYLEEVSRGPMQRSGLMMKSRILLMEEHCGSEDGSNICRTLTDALKMKYGIDFQLLSEKCCFVTDRASNMPTVVGASVSRGLVPYAEKWSWCCSHYINTIMKNTLAKKPAGTAAQIKTLETIQSDLKSAKTIVRIFKQGNWNAELPAGTNLLQEVETRFATSYTLCERFVKVPNDVERVIVGHPSHETASKEWNSMTVTRAKESDEIEALPALNAIVFVFKSLVHVQTLLESCQAPTLHLIVPYFEGIRAQLTQLTTSEDEYTSTVSGITLDGVEAMEDHPLHAAATRLVPSHQEFQFVPSSARRQMLKTSADRQIRKLMSMTTARKRAQDGDTDTTQTQDQGAASSAETGRRKRDFSAFMSLSKISDTRKDNSQGTTDELTRYLSNQDLVDTFMREYDVDTPLDAPLFWHHRKEVFPELAEVALRIFAIPASSATSERAFSEVSLVSSSRRCSMTSSNLGDCVISKSALASGVKLDKSSL